jgi:hypothetical protein
MNLTLSVERKRRLRQPPEQQPKIKRRILLLVTLATMKWAPHCQEAA